MKDIGSLLAKWRKDNKDSILEVGGVYIKTKTNSLGEKIKNNDIIKLQYTASFINNSVFYSTYKNNSPDEFQIGREGQMAEGLKIGLLNLNKGQKAEILVPSYLGFGSESKIVPPYTPIIYRVEVLEN